MDSKQDLVSMTAEIVSSYVRGNAVSAEEIPSLLHTVHRALAELGRPPAALPEPAREPAVAVKKSVTPDFIVCLEDGKKFKSLKRHLRTRYGMSPEEYRSKWGLPADYPMVAPNYARERSALAKRMGLGTGKKGEEL